jgi:hypothetical protein
MTKQKQVNKKWSELESNQKEEAQKKLFRAGWKDPKEYNRITFFLNEDGSIHGWNDPEFTVGF